MRQNQFTLLFWAREKDSGTESFEGMEPKGIAFENLDTVITPLSKAIGIGAIKRIQDRLQPTAVCICTADKSRNIGIKSVPDPVPEILFERRIVGYGVVFYAIENAIELLFEEICIGKVSRSVQHDIDLLSFLFG